MGYVDSILNLAGLLLWFKWRSLPFDPFNHRIPATLVGTLRRAAPSHFRRWHLLAAIAALVVLRAVIYWWVGPAVHWNGRMDLGVITLSFRSDLFRRMLLFSTFSFGLALAIFYQWLLLLSLLAGAEANQGAIHRLVRMALGGIDDWPRPAKLIAPFAATATLWWLATWALTWLEIIPRPFSGAQRLEESLVIGLGSYLVWKFAAVGLLSLHLLNTYIYFGRHLFWNEINTLAQTLMIPLRKIPWRVGKVDFAPLVAIGLLFLAAGLAERGLAWLYARPPF